VLGKNLTATLTSFQNNRIVRRLERWGEVVCEVTGEGAGGGGGAPFISGGGGGMPFKNGGGAGGAGGAEVGRVDLKKLDMTS